MSAPGRPNLSRVLPLMGGALATSRRKGYQGRSPWLVGARGFLGFRPLLFGMEREPAAPAGSTLFTFQYIAEYTGPFGGSRPRHHGTELRSADPAEDTFVAIAALAITAPPARRKMCGSRDSPTERSIQTFGPHL